jgi:tRNA pseudouridine65 synthase
MDIIFEDNYILAINKPNDLLVHHSHYARNIDEESLMEMVNDKYGKMHLVHRLDRKTSGIILLAKSIESLHKFQDLFTERNISKIYYAVVRGFSPAKGSIDTPIRIDETTTYKEALTLYTTLKNIELDVPVQPYEKSRYSLIKLEPKTGRMHQLRKHMNKISHPIVGDYKHGDRFHNRNFEQNYNWHNLFLHAQQLSFVHPFTDKQLTIQASFPENWNVLLEQFEWDII